MMRGPKKSPGGALALALLPGLVGVQGVGQWYNGDIGKGFAFFGLGLLGLGLIASGSETEISYDVATDSFVETAKSPGSVGAGALIWLGSYIWSSVDAYRSAHRKNVERGYTFIKPGGQSRYTLSMNHSQMGRDQIVQLTLVRRF
jgi:TM2 domain-containing membrane protein YozV